MSEAPRYTVSTIYEMAEIPIEALPRFVAELPLMLAQLKAIKAMSEIIGVEINPAPPVWIDDGLHNGDFAIYAGEEVAVRHTFDTRTGKPKDTNP